MDNANSSLLTNAALLNILEWMPYEEAKGELQVHDIALDIDEPILLVAASIGNFHPDSNSHEQFLGMVEVEDIFNQHLSKHFNCFRTSKADKTMIWMLQELDDDINNMRYCRESLKTAQKMVKEALGLSVSIVYDEFIDFAQIHERYRRLLSILVQVLLRDEEEILTDSSFFTDRHCESPIFGSGKYLCDIEALRQCLAAGDVELFEESLNRIIYAPTNNSTISKLQAYHTICAIVLDFFERAGLGEDLMARPDYFDIFRDYRGRSFFFTGMAKLVAEMTEKSKELKINQNDALIQGISNYIEANLAGDLSLPQLAKVFFVNAAYISRLYKHRVGVTIGEEIELKRIALAKRMLLRREYKISEIAREAGYESAAYFTRVFKKREGMTPQSWRRERF